jgi:transposase
MKRARDGGEAALRHHSPPGRVPRLTPEQRAHLPHLLERGAEAFGFRGDLWTRKRIAIVIRREFGVRYHPDSVGHILRACGWTVQKPIERATQRDEEAIQAWRDEHWPALKRGRQKAGRRSCS